jgi:hypothetical protein
MGENATLLEAVSMNNIATILFKRGQYVDAYQVLSDAISVYPAIKTGGNEQMVNVNDIPDTSFQQMHQRAEKMLLSVYNTSIASIESIVADAWNTSDMENVDFIMKSCLSHNSYHPSLVPIYIDEVDFDSVNVLTGNEMVFEDSAIIYNCAIAHFCIWLGKVNCNTCRQHQHNFHFNFAIQLLLKSHEICCQGRLCLTKKQPLLAIKLMNMEVVTVSTLLYAFRMLSYDKQLSVAVYHENNSRVRFLRSTLQQLISGTFAKLNASKTFLCFSKTGKHSAAA